jgi:hypothetical protein
MDFTPDIYKSLLVTLQKKGYAFQTFENFLQTPAQKAVILRHDVDKLPDNALKMAKLEHELGVGATYYFRAVPESFDEDIIRTISSFGHEIGYHYEDLAIARGEHAKAIRHFGDQLARFRRISPVQTICMHGSPLSKRDNRDLWKHYNYRDFGIIGEPYFDVDFNDVFYITDTGRKWNNDGASIRDRVESGFDILIKSTFHLIALAGQGALPSRMMITVHPQRWHDRALPWVKELVWQNIKNVVKRVMIQRLGL